MLTSTTNSTQISYAVPQTVLDSLGRNLQLKVAEVDSFHHGLFDETYFRLYKAYGADELDSIASTTEQLDKQRLGQMGMDSYRMLAFQRAQGGDVIGTVVFNYLHQSNIIFECYADQDAKFKTMPRNLIHAMEVVGQHDASKAGHSKPFAIVLEANPTEVALKQPNGYLLAKGVDYEQPPLGPGKRSVPLPLMFFPTDPTDASWVKDASGKIEGVTSEKVLQVVDDIYRNVYDRPSFVYRTPTTQYAQRVKDSIIEQPTIPLI